ncbi:hypothetical protein HN51_052628 [Arachis hypogaea]|uniref:Uncharacterized protein n=1 Tax=Arachis hypogaea TaxID=3818 RepID=A0A445C9W9_ARAHY|nr:probable serine/threonine-protein kinase DDB_G0282963 isoform X1 [Arachis ipaensis]XP_025668286.1 probable serine/threonine-protein kinase DDB_G0282963 isoform X1 [Arachis hypogaea]QHN94014.1 uncharacterized protein DS421_17g597630 [Arachis hypogaea]RYR47742.1 hypothetical protein Ahy_A07g033703 [Arachis hypogaea]
MNRNNNNNNGNSRDEKPCCYFHPKQLVIGVCPLCLNERLLIVAAKQGHHRHRHHHHHHHSSSSSSKASSHNRILQSSSSSVHRKPASSSSIHKIFAFGSLFSRQDSHQHQWKTQINYEYDASSSPEEDSFISIKFEENGIASWEKNTVSNTKMMSKNTTTKDSNNKSVIEHGKSRDMLRWRKRIGHIFHLMRWKRTGGVCHVGTKVEGVKVRKSNWMRTLTKRNKTME